MKFLDFLYRIIRREKVIVKPESQVEAERRDDDLMRLALSEAIRKEPSVYLRFYNYLFTLFYSRISRYMDYDKMDLLSPEISSALDIYKSEILQNCSKDNYFIVRINNQKEYEDKLKYALHSWIRYFEHYSNITFGDLIRRVLKYGDIFIEPIFIYENSKPLGIIGFRHLPEYAVHQVFIKRADGSLKPNWIMFPLYLKEFDPKFRKMQLQNINLQNPSLKAITSALNNTADWADLRSSPRNVQELYNAPFFQSEENLLDRVIFEDEEDLSEWLQQKRAIRLENVIHIPIQVSVFHPFGTSVLESLRLKWKQLHLLQTALLIYRIFYGVNRKIWKINVGKLPRTEAEKYINDFIQRIRKTTTFGPQYGYDEVARILGLIEDLFIPVQEGKDVALEDFTVNTNFGELDDLMLITRELEAGLKVPRARLLSKRAEGATMAQVLTLEDMRFENWIKELQRYIAMGFRKLLIKHFEIISKNEIENSKNIKERERIKETYNSIKENLIVEMPEPESAINRQKEESLRNRIDFINSIIELIGKENIDERKKYDLIEDILKINIKKYLKEE